MITVREHFQKLQDGYRELALEDYPHDLNKQSSCLADCVYELANFDHKRRAFWLLFWNHICIPRYSPLPPLPLSKEYTLAQAIEKLGKDEWRFNGRTAVHRANFFSIRKTLNTQVWIVDLQEETCIPVNHFRTVVQDLQLAIDACELLNNAKKD